MRTLVADLRDAARGLRTQPRFLIIASLTLGLGIGAVTAIFSVVNGVLFKPLPYPNPDRMVNIWSTAPGVGYNQFPLSPDLFLFYRQHNQVFEDMALAQGSRANLTESGPPAVVEALVTTHSYFATLRARAAHNVRRATVDVRTCVVPRADVRMCFSCGRATCGRATCGRATCDVRRPAGPHWLDEQQRRARCSCWPAALAAGVRGGAPTEKGRLL